MGRQTDDVGTVLRMARLAARLTQAEVGARVGYSASAISRLETGGRAPDWRTVRRLMHVLRIPPDALGLESANTGGDLLCGERGGTRARIEL